MEPLKIGIITDIHLGRDAYYAGQLRKLGHRALALTRDFVARMNEGFRPDLVLQLGDVVQDMTLEEDLVHYERICEVLSGLEAPVYPVAGNHDLIQMSPSQLLGFWRRFHPAAAAQLDGERLYYRFEVGGWEMIVLHSREETGSHVWMDEAQLAWLEATLSGSERPAVVWMHHTLADQDTGESWWFARHPHLALVRERAQARALIERSGRVRAVINGHLHWNRLHTHGGIPYVTIQSPIENFDNASPPAPAGSWGELWLSGSGSRLEVLGRDGASWRV